MTKGRAPRQFWTAAEDAVMRRLYPDTETPRLAGRLKRTVASVYRRAKQLGLAKSPAYLASPAACRLRRGDHVGRGFWYLKGHVPANKGLRRPGYGPGRMKLTQFTKGTIPHTWRPIGTEVIDPDGYRKRKMTDDRTVASRFNWKFVHVLVWEQAHGPVPPGHAIVFRNGRRDDIRLENLACLTRRELMAHNTVHNLPKPLASAIQLLGALKRQIRKRANAQEQDRRSA